MGTENRVIEIVTEVLELGDRGAELHSGSGLFGALPELDSLGVLELIANLEEEFAIEFGADDITDETFGTVGSLTSYIDSARR